MLAACLGWSKRSSPTRPAVSRATDRRLDDAHAGRSTGSARTPWPGSGGPRNLKPWQVDTFKVSNDPDFEAKLVDVVGLYLNPPERAVVFSFDEKTQVQALDRTQPSLPMQAGPGRHDDP